jgi:hypothetical protein
VQVYLATHRSTYFMTTLALGFSSWYLRQFNIIIDDLCLGLLLFFSEQTYLMTTFAWVSPLYFFKADILNDDLCLGFSS